MRLLRLLVAALIPYLVIMAPVRAVFLPWLVPFEYSLPGFPDDPVNIVYPGQGMKPAERVRLGIEGLRGTSDAGGTQILKNMRFDNGQRAFDDREVKHLDDVRDVINVLFPIHTVAALAFAAGAFVLWRRHRPSLGWALHGGAIFTLGLIAVICIGAVVAWDTAFTFFHKIFFSGDSWLFNWDDTLIRLYPVEFWQIITGMLAVTIAAICALFIWQGRRWMRA